MTYFATLADSLELPSVFQELQLAAQREECDWQPPFREMGAQTLLPHLQPMVHGLARLIVVRALRQLDQGDVTGARDFAVGLRNVRQDRPRTCLGFGTGFAQDDVDDERLPGATDESS